MPLKIIQATFYGKEILNHLSFRWLASRIKYSQHYRDQMLLAGNIMVVWYIPQMLWRLDSFFSSSSS